MFLPALAVRAEQSGLSLPISRVPARTFARLPHLGQAVGGIDVFNSQQYTYNVKAGIGEPPQLFEYVLDTGSSDFWVCDSSCQDSDCKAVTCFSSDASNTLIDAQLPFNLNYLAGRVRGEIVYDTVSFGSYRIKNQALATVFQTAELGLASSMTSGILGLCFPASAAISSAAGATLLENLMSSFNPAQRFFAFHLPRMSGSSDPNASFTIGKLDPQLAPNPSLLATSPVIRTGPRYDYWKLSILRLTLNGVPFEISSSRIPSASYPIAVLDSGTTLILGPVADVKAFYRLLGEGARYSPETGYQSLANRLPNMSFTQLTLHGLEGADGGWCTGGIQGNDKVNSADWLLGDTFLRNVYAVHYYEPVPQIGLLSLTNPDKALSEFRQQRGPDVDEQGNPDEEEDAKPDEIDAWNTDTELVKRWEHQPDGRTTLIFAIVAGGVGFVLGGIGVVGWRITQFINLLLAITCLKCLITSQYPIKASGIVLWSRAFTPDASQLASSSASPVNSLVREALIEGRTAEEKYEKDGYAVKWTFVNDLELIFVVAYQRILQLTYVDDLLAALKTLFVKMFQPFLATFVASLHALNSGKATVVQTASALNFADAFEGWDKIFDKLLRNLEDKAAQDRKSRLRPVVRAPAEESNSPPSEDSETQPTQASDTPLDEQQIARNVQALKNRLRGRGGKRGGRGPSRMDSGSGRDSVPNSDSESAPTKRKSKVAKAQRKWGDQAPTEDDMASLDFSMDSPADAMGTSQDLDALVDSTSLGTRSKDGTYEVKDWEFSKDDDDNAIADALKSADVTKSGASASSLGALGSLFSRLTGSKVLTEQDLKPVLDGMKQHLMKKNVAKEIADKVCEGVGESLVGKKVGGFQTTNAAVRLALSTSLTRILTPKTSTDLLLSIRTKLSSPLTSTQQRMPYSITFVGVNGVGKSTNLSKVCFWLIQNGFRVLIAACDTFRSGAVEQLRVHVRNLGMLGVNGATDSKGRVELFERGYGKDAAGIAREAISYAKDNDFDVVLIDTAGRMQDNEPLMRALAKLVAVNTPDKIIFVGEALVGNEAVDQLTKFDRALRDFSSASGAGKGRGIDGMLVTKWDTVDDKVGAALSMTYVTGQPIIFVGCGQTYTDLRQLRVANVVQAILAN
ncbi:Signal recognition particle binding protein [Mycena indigotica]|uniref:Signal recognition particle binding protein n=1 Tax=Mycena indigotica TaxID=2126181 RepID=A0A8H6S969_9AGAR|nr:Signal recognition particle binding protein [Mycena indigotica]KAF7295310.1 Signal recognition particle binding protein [Mycena indigotica]